jgi:hypothetical protein
MRFLALLIAAPVIAACDVPDVNFYDAAANDAVASLDAGPDVDGATDARDDTDAASDGPAGDGFTGYCMDPDGGVPPPTLGCCPGGNGEVCWGGCMVKACQACGACVWPNVCCTNGVNGVCKSSC